VKQHAAAFVLWFVVLWWLWQLLSGEWGRYGWIAGAAAAAVGATLGELARTRAEAHGATTWTTVASIPSALGMVFVDFGIVLYALFTRRSGKFEQANAAAAWPAYLATLSPNAYVVGDQVTHHLVPNKKSQEPV
jgi:hypothetical protein